jgi:TIR domain
MFDVFLAHNSQDKPLIRVVYRKLRSYGLNPWLDEEHIPPGTTFQDEIQEAITQVKSSAIFFGKSGLGRWQAFELKAFISQCIERKIPVIPVLLPGVSEIPDSLPFLREFHAVTFRDDIEDDQSTQNLYWGITKR